MGILDSIKDTLGIDSDAEKQEKEAAEAKAEAEEATREANEAVAEAKEKTEEAAKEAAEAKSDDVLVGPPAPAPKVEPKVEIKPEPKEHKRPEHKPEHKPEPKFDHYTVKSGDTLSEIGQRYGVDYHVIAKLNDIENPDLIFPGQVFKIPKH